MRRLVVLISVLLAALILAGCAAGRYPYPKSDLARETWQQQVQLDPTVWAQGATEWFRDGGKTTIQRMNENAGYNEAMSETIVNVGSFDKLRVNGDFYLQLTGAKDDGTVSIVGPNDAIRFISVKKCDDSLCIDMVGKPPANIGRVTVHVGIKNLKKLVHHGAGNVEGIRLYGNDVTIEASGSGCMYLSGRLNIKCINTRSSGSINIFTVDAYGTEINSAGAGAVNIYANKQILLRNIVHTGTGDINIIRATSNGLLINAKGSGLIGIAGRVNIKEIRAYGKTCVFIAMSSSDAPCIYVGEEARVGMNGKANILTLDASRKSKFYGRYLEARDVYAKTSGIAHANIWATRRAWAKATDYSSIYFFGNRKILSAYEEHSGTVIPMTVTSEPDRNYNPYMYKKHRDYKDEMLG